MIHRTHEDIDDVVDNSPPDPLLYAIARSRGQCVYCGGRFELGQAFQQHTNASCPRRPTTALFTVLDWIQSRDAFRTLRLRLEPLISYETHRAGLVELVFGDGTQDILSRLTGLEGIRVELEDRVEGYSASWWVGVISERNPKLQDMVSVTVHHRSDRFDHGQCLFSEPESASD